MNATKHKIICADAGEILPKVKHGSVDLIFIDPPFNTGKTQSLLSSGEFYSDNFDDFKKFIYPKLEQSKRILNANGSIFVLLDYREVHDVKCWMDEIYGRTAFQGEIIWHFETGGQSKKKWSNKHNTILWYSSGTPTFNFDKIPSETSKAPKAGYDGDKKLCSVWNINMSTTDPQRVGYPTQKPEELLRNIISVHSNPNGIVMDFFAGSGTTSKVCKDLGRNSISIDVNPRSVEIIKRRLGLD